MAAEIHVGDVGTKLVVTIKDEDGSTVDLSTAEAKQIKLRKPDGTTVTKTAAYETDGTDGVISYTTTSADDLDSAGKWSLQAVVDFGSTVFSSDVSTFLVVANL